jgi:hypothetical protein
MNAALRDRRADVAAQGLVLLSVEQNRHFKFVVRAPDGCTTTLTVATTTCCRSARAKFRADLRRFAEGRA